MDNFVLYNILGKEDDVDLKEEIRTQGQETTKDSKSNDPSEQCVRGKEELTKVRLSYYIFNFSYEHHSYIPRGSVVTFAENEDGEKMKFLKWKK